ncbi:MAG: rod shape-determining protein MreD [Alphaproteobacteria bacterium]|nr:rod shape-determining protein MreD [Alphaproteobacteria bacterium]
MKHTAAQRMDMWARLSLPVASLVILCFLVAVPVGLPGFSNIRPEFALIGVFYWSVFRDDLLPVLALFLIGLFQDALTGAPMGMTSLLLLAAHGFAQTQRKALVGRPFFILWTGFALMMAPLGLAAWLLSSVLEQAVQPLEPVLGQVALTVALFPVVVIPLIAAQRTLLKEV